MQEFISGVYGLTGVRGVTELHPYKGYAHTLRQDTKRGEVDESRPRPQALGANAVPGRIIGCVENPLQVRGVRSTNRISLILVLHTQKSLSRADRRFDQSKQAGLDSESRRGNAQRLIVFASTDKQGLTSPCVVDASPFLLVGGFIPFTSPQKSSSVLNWRRDNRNQIWHQL